MGGECDRDAGLGLERSGRPGETGDWLRMAPSEPGMERIEARFAGRAYARHRHDSYALGITLDGVQSFDYRGSRADSLAGDVIVLHPDEPHDGRAGRLGGFRYRMLYLDPAELARALGPEGGALPFLGAGVQQDPRLKAALGPALADLARPLAPLERVQAVQDIAEALSALDPSRPKRPPEGLSERAVAEARAYLEAHWRENVTAEEIEAVSGLDRHRLARQFRRRLGTSPHRYLVQRRLSRLRRKIAQGAALADAAVDCGFADQAHMTRHFKATYGLSPGRWRRLLQAERR